MILPSHLTERKQRSDSISPQQAVAAKAFWFNEVSFIMYVSRSELRRLHPCRRAPHCARYMLMTNEQYFKVYEILHGGTPRAMSFPSFTDCAQSVLKKKTGRCAPAPPAENSNCTWVNLVRSVHRSRLSSQVDDQNSPVEVTPACQNPTCLAMHSKLLTAVAPKLGKSEFMTSLLCHGALSDPLQHRSCFAESGTCCGDIGTCSSMESSTLQIEWQYFDTALPFLFSG